MPQIIHRIHLDDLAKPSVTRLTREGAIALAHEVSGGIAAEVQILVVFDNKDDEEPIEVATIELNSLPDGTWWLQYVSHPEQSFQLTARIKPCIVDFASYIQHRNARGCTQPITPICAQLLHDEGLGPLASLDLRLHRPAPLVPSMDDLAQLMVITNP